MVDVLLVWKQTRHLVRIFLSTAQLCQQYILSCSNQPSCWHGTMQSLLSTANHCQKQAPHHWQFISPDTYPSISTLQQRQRHLSLVDVVVCFLWSTMSSTSNVPVPTTLRAVTPTAPVVGCFGQQQTSAAMRPGLVASYRTPVASSICLHSQQFFNTSTHAIITRQTEIAKKSKSKWQSGIDDILKKMVEKNIPGIDSVRLLSKFFFQ